MQIRKFSLIRIRRRAKIVFTHLSPPPQLSSIASFSLVYICLQLNHQIQNCGQTKSSPVWNQGKSFTRDGVSTKIKPLLKVKYLSLLCQCQAGVILVLAALALWVWIISPILTGESCKRKEKKPAKCFRRGPEQTKLAEILDNITFQLEKPND